MKCGPCISRNHEDCANEWVTELVCNCDHDSAYDIIPTPPVGSIGAALNLESEVPDSRTHTRRYKNDDAVTDQQSTGRKRAAALYPLKDSNGSRIPCDFSNKARCLPSYMEVQIDGCGLRPGTFPKHAQARHHNDYNTLNNERSNVALLCHDCHNLLHAKNDAFKDNIYERIYGFRPETDDLKHANKALRSGVVGGGQIKDKEKDNGRVQEAE
jgi:hypothetical protein